MRPDSPGPAEFVMVFVPTRPPSPKATRTKASHPKVAVFQWLALQRPMRAARLRLVCVVRGMTALLSGRVGERVVEGVEGTVGRNRDLELIAGAGVLDRDGQSVLVRVPEQQDVDAVALARGEFAGQRVVPMVSWRSLPLLRRRIVPLCSAADVGERTDRASVFSRRLMAPPSSNCIARR